MTTNPLSVEELDLLDEDGPACIRMSDWNRLIAAARKGIEAHDMDVLIPISPSARALLPLPTGDYTHDEYAMIGALTDDMMPEAPLGFEFVQWEIAPPDDAFARFTPAPTPGKAEATQDTGKEQPLAEDGEAEIFMQENPGTKLYAASPSEDRGECGGCTCKRQIPYVDFSHEPHCRLYFALPSNTGEEVERVVERLRRWAHSVRCEIPFHRDQQEILGDGTDLEEDLDIAASLLSSLTEEKNAWRARCEKLWADRDEPLTRAVGANLQAIDLLSQLAEAKAENERLREALETIATKGYRNGVIDYWCDRARAALTGGA